MFGIRVSADGRVIEIPNPPQDLIDSAAVGAVLLGSVGFDWGIDPFDLIDFTTVTETGLLVIAAGSDDGRPVNLPGEAAISALSVFGLEVDGGSGQARDAVWVLQVVPSSLTDDGPLRFAEVPAEVAETVKRAAESAPVEGRAVASVHVPDGNDDAALRALVESLADVDGVTVLTLDPGDPAGSLASLAAVLGEAPPDVYADVSNVRA